MIGLARKWAPSGWADTNRIAASLGLFAGHPADSEIGADISLFNLAGPRARPTRGWRAARSPSGIAVLLYGWIDNPHDLAARLGLNYQTPELLYGAAIDAWGDRGDAQITGTYATIMPMPDGRIRMARSPLGGWPLFYASDRDAAVVCSIPRPLFAAGWPQRLCQQHLLDTLALDLKADDPETLYKGVMTAPDGAITYLARDGVSVNRWYDPTTLAPVRFRRDADYVEAANSLLADAVRNALSLSGKPAATLSGGLDSAIMTAEILRQLPADQRLPTFTFHPLDEWNGPVPPSNFADDRPYVRAFAAMHPRIDTHFVDNRGASFDHKAQEFFLACSTACPGLTVGTPHHGVYQAAADSGADWIFSASAGNLTYSMSPGWAYPEFLLHGKWRQLWQMAAARPGDPRSVLRRIAAFSVMPLLPRGVARTIRRAIHRGDDQPDWYGNLLNKGIRKSGDSVTGAPPRIAQPAPVAEPGLSLDGSPGRICARL